MKVYVVLNSCAFIVGVFRSEARAKAALIEAEFDDVVGAYIETVEMNKVFTGAEIE